MKTLITLSLLLLAATGNAQPQNRFPLYSSGSYTGGFGDHTNVSDAQLKLHAASGYIRVSHLSANAAISTVYNFEAGKNVYWGEDSDGGNFIFRGRNVGIGASAPQARLHISGGAPVLALSDIDIPISVSNPNWMVRAQQLGQFAIQSTTDFTNISDRLVISYNGNVGIGASPMTLLDLGALKFDKISSFPAEGTISEYTWGNYIIGDVSNTSARALRLGVSNDGYTRAEIHIDNGNRADGTISFKTSNANNGALSRMVVDGTGNVGIGTVTPDGLQINSTMTQETTKGLNNIRIGVLGNTPRIILDNVGYVPFEIDNASGRFRIFNPGVERFTIDADGNVGIGTNDPDTRLTVKGVIHTNEIRVDVNAPIAPDYVFEKDYNLLPLSEVEAYVNQNKHLPEVPSAKEMEENGLNLKEMNLLLLKKVEELTLHLIEQHKNDQLQQAEIDKLKEENRSLQAKVDNILKN